MDVHHVDLCNLPVLAACVHVHTDLASVQGFATSETFENVLSNV